MGVNLEEECRTYELQMQGGPAPHSAARPDIDLRAYTVQPESPLIARSIPEIEALARDARLFVERMRRAGHIVDPDGDTSSSPGGCPGHQRAPRAAGRTRR